MIVEVLKPFYLWGKWRETGEVIRIDNSKTLYFLISENYVKKVEI